MDTDPSRNYYCCQDGRWIALTLQPGEDWSRFCRVINHPELESEERFDTPQKRAEDYSRDLISLLQEIFLTRDRDDWLEIFKENDFIVSPVNRPIELEHDSQIRENYPAELDHPTLGRVKMPGFPVHFSGARAGTRKAAPLPLLGEDTEEVLKMFGGYSEQEIEKLIKEEVI